MIQYHQAGLNVLRIIQLDNAKAAKDYYKKSDYYLGDAQELPGYWGGAFAKEMNLTGAVQYEQFERLCDNLHPHTGKQLTAKHVENRRVGWDINWHAPKSVSLAFELLGDRQVLDAFRTSVNYAMTELEKDIKTRVRIGGVEEDRYASNAAWGVFIHRTARPVGGLADPHLHAHAVMFNATSDAVEDKVKAIQIGDIKRDAGYYEALFHARLAEEMRAIGYGIRQKGKSFELLVSDDLIKKFSRRASLIENIAEKIGLKGAAKDKLGQTTRERKSEAIGMETLRGIWLSQLTDKDIKQLDTLKDAGKPLPSIEESARFAMGHAFQNEAVVNWRKVYEVGLRHGIGNVKLETLRSKLDDFGLLVSGEMASTRELLAFDADVVKFGQQGRFRFRPVGMTKEDIGTLTQGQQDAVRHVLTSEDRVILVRGVAGAGKTTAMKIVADTIRKRGYAVKGLSNNNKAVEQMAEIDGNASTIARFLRDEKARQSLQGGFVILDEASQVGIRDFHHLITKLDEIGARIVCVGDQYQHAAVAAGAPFRLLNERAGLPVAQMNQIVRQQMPLFREACEAFSQWDVERGMQLVDSMGSVREMAEPYRMETLVADFLAERKDGNTVLIVAPSHAEGEQVNVAIRDGLKRDGFVSDIEQEVEQYVNVGWSPQELAEAKKRGTPYADVAREENLVLERYGAYRKQKIRVAVGDELRATASFKSREGKRITNGTALKVNAIGEKGIQAVTATGIHVTVNSPHIAYDYARTSHSVQSKTVDVVLVAESKTSLPVADRAQIYVSASRARKVIRIYTDNYDRLLEAVKRERVKANASDLMDTPIDQPSMKESARTINRIMEVVQRIKESVSYLTQRKARNYAQDRTT